MRPDDGTGIVGLAPEAEVHVCRVSPGGSAAELIEALDYCIHQRVYVAIFAARTAARCAPLRPVSRGTRPGPLPPAPAPRPAALRGIRGGRAALPPAGPRAGRGGGPRARRAGPGAPRGAPPPPLPLPYPAPA